MEQKIADIAQALSLASQALESFDGFPYQETFNLKAHSSLPEASELPSTVMKMRTEK